MCGWASAPGYGNNWDQRLDLPPITWTGLSGVVIQFRYRCDSEPSYDYTYVEALNAAGTDYVFLASYDADSDGWQDSGPILIAGPPGTVYKNPLQIRFRFDSDGAWSDQDCLWPTDGGGFMCDNITVSNAASPYNVLFFDDCEPGGDVCTPSVPPGVGDLWHLITRKCPDESWPHSWWCGEDADTTWIPPNVRNSLFSPPIDISALALERFRTGNTILEPMTMHQA